MKKFYGLSVILVLAVLTYINYPGDLASIDLNNLVGRTPQSQQPIVPDKEPIKREKLKVLTKKDVANIKLVNVDKIPPRNQLLIKAIIRGANTVIRSKNRQDEVFVLKEINALAPNYQTTLGTNKKNKQESNQRLFTGSSATKYSAPSTQMAMAFYNNSLSGIITRPDGSSTYIQSDSKTGKIYSYTAKESEPSCSESVDSNGQVIYNYSPTDDELINIKKVGQETEVFAAENSGTGGTTYDEEEEGKPTGINPPEYDKSLININWLVWVDKSSSNARDGNGDLILTLEEHASLQLAKVAMMNAIYQNQLGIKFTLQEIVLIPENDPQNDPVYTSDEPEYAPDMSQPQYCLQAGARCGPIGAAKHLMEKYRPREDYHWDQVPYQMKKKDGDTYKWGGLAGCCAGATSGVFVNNIATSGLGGAVPHETGHNIGVSHLMGGGIMGGSAVDGRSFFSFVREGSLKGIELGSNQAYNKMSPKPWFTSLHPKYSQMRNPKEMPWAVGDNYQLIVGSDPSSREITISPMDNDLLFTPEGKWNESLDIPEIGPIYPPNAGVLTLFPDNQVKFIANPGFYGPAKFRYTLRGNLPTYLHASTDPKCLHSNKHNSTYSKIEIEDCNIETEKPEDKDYNFNIPFFPSESPIFKIKNNGGCIRPYSGSEDISTYGQKNFADVYFVGACTGEENWDQWKFEPVAMDIPDVFRIKNKFSEFCLNSMNNMQSECNDINNYWQVKATPDPDPQEKCLTGGNSGITPAALFLKNCGDIDTENKENQDYTIENFPAQSEIKKGNSGGFLMVINSSDNTVSQEGLNIHLRWNPNYDKHYGNLWNFQQVEAPDKYRIINDFSGLCLSRTQTQISCSYKNTTWKISSLGNNKYQITSVPDGDYDTTYQLVSVRQPREGWLHAGDVTIDVVEGSDAPTPIEDLTQNLQVTIPMNSFQYFGKDSDIEEFIFNPLIDLTLMPQTLDGNGVPISIYRNPIQMDITLGTSGQNQSMQRNAISILTVDNLTPALTDHRVIKGTFTEGGVSKNIANGYLAVKLKRDIGTGDYLEGPAIFNVKVKDQRGDEKDVTVNVITPIARIHLDRIELPVNETLNLTTKAYVASPIISWRKIFGPGNFVVTGNNGQFSAPGKYLLRMTAIKNGYATFQEVDINVLTESGDKLTPDEPPAPGEAPETNQIIIGKDGSQYLISPDGTVSRKDPITGEVTPHEEDYKQFSLVNRDNYSYLDPEGFIFVMKNGTKVDTGVKGKHVSMGVDGFIIAILDDQECLNRGKSAGCLFEYKNNTWVYWGYQKFTGKNSLHQTIEEMRDVFAKDIHVLSKDHIAIVDLNGALFEMSEHETRGKEFWELGGVWRKVKISIHGRIVGIGEDNILKKWYQENWFPIKQNVGDFAFEHNGRITAVDFDNEIEKIPELYFSSFTKVSAGGNVDLNDISLGQDGLGHITRLWSNNARTTNYFYKNLAKLTLVNTNIPNTVWKEMNISVANQSKICVAINNSEGVKVYNGIEVSAPEISTNFQKNVTCSSDNAVMSIITDEKATESDVPRGSALQLVDGQWYPVGGKLVQLDIGSEHFIYGVDNTNRVWKKEGKLWKRIPGLMKQISVGVDGSLAGIGTDDFIYLMVEGVWVNLDVKAKKISASINNQLAYIGMDDVAYTNYPGFFTIPIIHDIKKSFVRPRKGVAYRMANLYRPIHTMGGTTTIWEADNLPAGCVNLGQVITENNSPPNFDTRCYNLREEIMKNPVSFEELAILDVPNDIRVYRPVPEAGFSCVSHIAWAGTDPPPLDHIYCIDSAYIENGVLERKGENLYRILPANGKSVTKNYFQYWEPEESSEGPTSFYLPLPEEKSIFSIFPSAFAQTPEPPGEDPEEAPVGAALVGEEFLTTPENLAVLDDELEELADEELEETIPEVPEFPPPVQEGGPIGEIPQVGGPEGGRAPGQVGAFAQTSCSKATKLDGSASLIFISNFLIGFLLTIFRRRK